MDEVQEILVRLPIKDAIRLKLVCKRWNALISSPEFAKFHQRHTDDNSSLHLLLLCRSEITGLQHPYTIKIEPYEYESCLFNKPAEKLDYEFDLDSYPINSCNGLVLYIAGLERNKIRLWNPATRECKNIRGLCLPRCWVSYWGFGYDSIIDDYKILLLGKQPTNVLYALIFTLRTNKWRRVLLPSDDDCRFSEFFEVKKNTKLPSRPVLAGDTLYWKIDDNDNLLAFSILHESFEIIRLPNPQDDCTNPHSCVAFFICQIRQSLCACWVYNELVENDPRGPRLYLESWVLEDKKWKKFLKLRGLEAFSDHLNLQVVPKLFELKGQCKFLVTDEDFTGGVVFDSRGSLHYPPRSVRLFKNFGSYNVPTCIFDYTPSLVSPTHHFTMNFT